MAVCVTVSLYTTDQGSFGEIVLKSVPLGSGGTMEQSHIAGNEISGNSGYAVHRPKRKS